MRPRCVQYAEIVHEYEQDPYSRRNTLPQVGCYRALINAHAVERDAGGSIVCSWRSVELGPLLHYKWCEPVSF